MKKEELLELKQKLSQLSEEEKKLRNLESRKIALGEKNGPMTGYPSIDKPQLNLYRKEPIKEINVNQIMYNMVFDNNMNMPALSYLGTKWNLGRLKEETDNCAKAFYRLGLRKNDVVLVGVSNSPQAFAALLAINKIGATSKWFDIRANENNLIEYANSSNCKYMISFDLLVSKVQNVINDTSLEKVIVMNPAGPLPMPARVYYSLKNKYDIDDNLKEKFISYDNFIHGAKKENDVDIAEFDKNRPAIMIQSSGTTGKPKTIVHSDYSITQFTRELAFSDLPLGKTKTMLVALPPWIAYGLIDATITPLALGTEIELCPKFDPDTVFKYAGKFTVSFAAPFHYRYLRDNFSKLNYFKKNSIYNADSLASGGDKMSVEENKEFENLFRIPLINGYGNNESLGALTVGPVKANKYGSVGIPKYDETIICYDNEKNVELPYGEKGEVCALTNTMFLGYENNIEETNSTLKLHDDGNVWLHTGDLGYIDSEGYLFLAGRSRRVIIRLGFKISAYTIEDAIAKNNIVKECVAVSVNDSEEEHVPMVFVLLKDDIKITETEAIDIILDHCQKELKEYEIPKIIKIVDKLPYTQNGKYDFVKLEKIGNEYVNNIENNNSNQKILKKNQ